MSLQIPEISSGLVNPVHGAQSVFRGLLKAMSEPCSVVTQKGLKNPPVPLNEASYAIALTLLDPFTAVALSDSLLSDEVTFSLRFHTSTPILSDVEEADFVFCDEQEVPDLGRLNGGSDAYPDQSCTLVIQCESFDSGLIFRASGPGIEHSRHFRCSAITHSLLEQRNHLSRLFPLGIDIILTCGNELFCLPRTTRLRVENKACM